MERMPKNLLALILKTPQIVDDLPTLFGRKGFSLTRHERASVLYRLIKETIRTLAEDFQGEVRGGNEPSSDRAGSFGVRSVAQSAVDVVKSLAILEGGSCGLDRIAQLLTRLDAVHTRLLSLSGYGLRGGHPGGFLRSNRGLLVHVLTPGPAVAKARAKRQEAECKEKRT